MKPYGRRARIRDNLICYGKPLLSWWEVEYNNVNKKRARFNARREIMEESMINIVDSEGDAIIRLDEVDAKKDVLIKDGKEISLSDAIKAVGEHQD